jgi:SagB-type dehydrogenase family enzyme
MTLVAGPSTAARTLTGFWNEARLHAHEAKSTSVRPAPGVVPWRAALEDVLNVGYGLQTQCRFAGGAWEQVRWRTTPSAGALYPFEVIACIVNEGSYLWDVRAGRLLDCGLPTLTADDVIASGLLTNDGQRLQVLLVVLARPWMSMKKYRLRGYPYCHLDIGHVATNLAMYSTALGYAPTAHLRFSRTWLADRLRLGGLCREPVAVLSFASVEPIRLPEHRLVEPVVGAERTGLELPGASELENWDSLKGILSFDFRIDPPCAPARTRLVLEPAAVGPDRVVLLPDGHSPPRTAAESRSAILARRSAKGFQDRPLNIGHIATVLGALRGEGLLADGCLDDSSRLGVCVIARNVDGLSGVFTYAPARHALYRVDDKVDDFGPGCMKQYIAAGAAALLLVHAPIGGLLERYSAFAELHFHAAQLGQRLHLAVARLDGIGMTCLGGFDGEQCAALARLERAREALYVILLGVPDETATKHDRLRVAYSHGYTTEER